MQWHCPTKSWLARLVGLRSFYTYAVTATKFGLTL